MAIQVLQASVKYRHPIQPLDCFRKHMKYLYSMTRYQTSCLVKAKTNYNFLHSIVAYFWIHCEVKVAILNPLVVNNDESDTLGM